METESPERQPNGLEYMLPADGEEKLQWLREWEKNRYNIPQGRAAVLELLAGTVILLVRDDQRGHNVPVKLMNDRVFDITSSWFELPLNNRLIPGVRQGSQKGIKFEQVQLVWVLQKVNWRERISAYLRWKIEKNKEEKMTRLDISK